MKEQIVLDIHYPIVKNHKVYDQELLPGLAYIDMIYQLFREQGYDYANLELKNLTIYNPLLIGQDYSVLLSIEYSERNAGQWQIRVDGQKQYNGTLSADKMLYITAEMHQRKRVAFDETLEIGRIRDSANQAINLEDVYEEYREQALVHTGFMKASGTIYKADTDILIDISLGQNALASAAGFMFHPTLIDGSGIGAGVLFPTQDNGKKQLYLPLFYESFCAEDVLQEQCIARVQASSIRRSKELIYATMEFFDQFGKKVAELKNFTGKLVRDSSQFDPKRIMAEQLDKEICQVASPISMKEAVNSGPESLPADGIEAFLQSLLAEYLHKTAEQIETQVGYYEMGLDSAGLLMIVKAIENKINAALSPTLLFEYTTIAELAEYLSANFAIALASNSIQSQEAIDIKKIETESLDCQIPAFSVASVEANSDDIAIIGMAGRYPMAQNLNEFWENLRKGKDCISEIPKSRWNWHDFTDVKSPSGKEMSKWGGFIEEPECFDPQFFRITPREAEQMDPQERLFLQICWETIEDAGYTPKTLVKARGRNKRRHVGVFAGVMHKDYMLIGAEAIAKGQAFPLSLSSAPIANRVSYFCNFHGPSIAVDTLCSSSLTAVHLAIESIRNGESEVALAGGVNLSLHPYKYLTYGLMDMHSSDGYCHTFGKDGNGYVSGEGVGAVLLKPLNKAIQDRDCIYAVIKGSTINHGGTVSGITVPNPLAQGDMLLTCLEKTQIDPRTISYVEAHGTGTSLGDPIEIEGLMKAFRCYTQDRKFCSIGSVKSNIGHTESAAGISGLQKIVLQLYHKMLIPSLHSEELNPYIEFEKSPFYVQHKTETWEQPTRMVNGENVSYPRRASLSSFGAYGSNANIIVEEFVSNNERLYDHALIGTENRCAIIPLSAKNKERLKVSSERLLEFLKSSSEEIAREQQEEMKAKIRGRLETTVRKMIADMMHVPEDEIINEQEWHEFGVDIVHIAQIKEKIQEECKIHSLELNQNSSIRSVVSDVLYACQNDAAASYISKAGIQEAELIPSFINLSLSALSYTLQVGREAMEERVVFLVKDMPELIQKLEEFTAGKVEIDNCWHGHVKNTKGNSFNESQEFLEVISNCMKQRQFGKIAEFWVKGLEVDWNLLYGAEQPCRISLPTYPFVKERYWVPEADLAAKPLREVIHPLVQKNTSDFTEQRFSSIFTGKEFFLNDHRIKTKQVLPGVAYLEMARAAVEQAAGVLSAEKLKIKLKDVAWIRPVVVEEQAVQVHIGLFPEENGEIVYEIYSELGEAAQPVVHSQGRAVFSEASIVPVRNLSDIKDHCNKSRLSASECYEAFKRMGIEYGPGHQGISAVYAGNNLVLAKLTLPKAVSNTKEDFVIHPSLMDAALQASVGLLISQGELHTSDDEALKLALPFAVQEVEIFKKCTTRMWAVVQSSENSKAERVQKLNIDLCDEEGNVCVRIKGLSTRVLEGEVGSAGSETLLLEPHWEEKGAAENSGKSEEVRHFILLCEQDGIVKEGIETHIPEAECRILQSQNKSIGKRFETYAAQMFEEVQTIIKDKSISKVLLQVVITGAAEQQLFAGLSGLLKTAQLENPKFIGQLIEVEPGEDTQSIIMKLLENRHMNDSRIRYQSGKRWIISWRELEVSQEIETAPWKDKGVYLITGGAGGLGLIFAEEIAQNVKDAVLVLTGRSLLSESKKYKLTQLKALGAQVIYKQVDVTEKQAVNDLIQNITEEYGSLKGIIHSAGIIRDNFIFKKSKEEVQSVLSPKVTGLVNLDEASRELPLDFFIFFSSGAGAIGNIGQADYSMANAFMDTYATYRNELVEAKQRQGKTLAINWPLWKEGGMQGSAGTEQMLMQRMGMTAMQTSTGIKALQQSAASGKQQVMVIEGDPKRIRAVLLGQATGVKTIPVQKEEKAVSGMAEDLFWEKAENYFKKQLSIIIKLPVNRIETDAPLENYGIDSIMIMQLTTQLENTFGSLSKTLFFEYQTIKELTEYFVKSHREQVTTVLGLEDRSGEESGRMEEAEKDTKVKSTFSSRRTSRFAIFPRQHPEKRKAMDIAIIGVSGRYPQAKNIKEFWNNLKNGKDCITDIPKDRWDHSVYFDEDKNKPGTTYSKWGGFLDGVEQFDPLFFNISPREAELMDPQERLFLQCVHETLEDAGYTREALSCYRKNGLTGNVGVYVGVMYEEYQLYGAQEQIQGRPVAFAGNPSSIANRVSYFYNFHGPSMAVDTMCSSSLTSIHLACQSLQSGGCEMAIAGGVNVSVHPNKYLLLAQSNFISSKGRCESFGQGGDGYVPGEGVGAVLLKPLDKAIADGDHIYGVIKGVAVNHGGKTNGYTVPNPNAQANAIGQTIKEAGIDPRTISYIEAHGTGTSLGDPIEVAGLVKVFEQYTQDKKFCAIGSAKSNIGHCESAAGIAGLTKVLLQFRYKQLVPSLHSNVLNPNINFDATPFIVQQELTEWKRPVITINGEKKEYPRIAGISAFGAGGSNAHIIIAEHISDRPAESAITITSQNPAIILLSAKNEDRLKEQAVHLLEAIKEEPADMNVADIAYTLQVGREAMEERLGLIVGSMNELKHKLQGFVDGREEEGSIYRGQIKRNKDMLAIFAADEEMQEAIDKWIERKKYAKVLELWVKGLNFDWNKLYEKNKPQRISLPAYPFSQERYWVPKTEQRLVKDTAASLQAHAIHPLLHQNMSNFSGPRYSTIFTGQEPFITGEKLSNKRMLPPICFVEMARAAVAEAEEILKEKTTIQLHDVIWAQPIFIGKEPVEVRIDLLKDAGEIAYEIYSESEEGTELVICQGNAKLLANADVPVIDLAAVENQLDKCDLKFKGIDQIYTKSGQIVAKISGALVSDTGGQMLLSPSALDFVLQTSAALVKNIMNLQFANPTLPGQVLPCTVEEIAVYEELTCGAWLLIQYDGSEINKFDIEILDQQGRICMRMRKLEVQFLDWKVEKEENLGMRVKTFLQKEWELCPCMQTRSISRNVAIFTTQETKELALQLAGGLSKSEVLDIDEPALYTKPSAFEWKKYDGCIDLVGCGAKKQNSLEWLTWLQNLIEQGHREGAMLLGVTKGLEAYQNSKINLSGAARAGLYRMLQSEYGHLRSRHLDVELSTSDNTLVQQILSEFLLDTEDAEVCYRDGKRHRAVLAEIKARYAGQQLAQFPKEHVLWITGGTRGLGYLCAQYFVKKYGVKHLVLTGREVMPPREEWDDYDDSPSILQKIRAVKALEAQGAEVKVLSIALADKEIMRRNLLEIKNTMGPIGGIIHCAGVGDKENPAFIRKSIDSIQQVFQPKIEGLDTIYEVFKGEPLQFFVLYSSVSSIIPSLASGQSDYAMANAYMDYFAQAYSSSCPIISVQWPSWKETGMGEVRSRVYTETGLLSQTNEEGLALLDDLLSEKLGSVILPAVVNPDLWNPKQLMQRAMQKALLRETIKTTIPESAEESDSLMEATQAWLKSLFSRELKIDSTQIEADTSFQDYGMDSILLAQVIRKMERETQNISVEPSVLIEYSTLQSLTAYFVQNYREALTALFSISGAETKSIAQRIDQQTTAFKVLARRTNRELREENANSRKQKIAIVGIACHFPDAVNPQEFWNNLRSGKDSIREVPKSRWDWEKYYDPREYREGKSISKWGAFLEKIEMFDPHYFKIPESLAPQIDPLQRQWLEVSAQALADAGYDKKSLWGKRVGVFAGARAGDFANRLKGANKDRIIGVGQNFITVHLAHIYNFKGPNMVIDAACASSLAAIHLAVKSIQSGEAEMALAGGVDILLDEAAYLTLSAEKILSPDGRCKTFNAEANGIGLGEGCGVLVLKPLKKAIQDNNKIYGVIDGSAVNCDGNTMGVTTPNPEAQKELLKAALADANITPETISYIETHGTGTLIGDPIELKSLTQIFTEHTSKKQFCGVGSVKSNMGHLLSAAGAAGIIKVLLAITQQELPPTLHCDKPNPRFNFQNSPLYPVQKLKNWINETGILRAGISAFGLGGNNAHIIVSNEGIPKTHKASLEPKGNKIIFNRKYYWPAEFENNHILKDASHHEDDEADEFNELFTIEEVY